MGTRDYDVYLRGTGYTGYPNSQNMSVNDPSAKHAWRSSSNSKRHRPAGWIPPTSYSMEEGSWQRPRGSIVEPSGWRQDGYLNVENPLSMFGKDCSALGIPQAFPSYLANRALQNVRLKVKDQSFNAAQAFAERAQTARLVGGALTRIAQAAILFKRRRYEAAFARLDFFSERLRKEHLANTVLEFNYGVRPLIQDIYGACEALDKAGNGVWINTYRSRVQEKYSLTRDRGTSSSTARATGEVFYGAMARLDVIPGNTALQTAVSLGLTNPVSLAWELLPFSFVVDWAWPLGDYFSQFDALAGVEVKGYSMSNLTKIRVKYEGRKPAGTNQLVNWDSYYRLTKLNRTASLSVPFATLPRVKDPFNSKEHVLNGLALLAGAFR